MFDGSQHQHISQGERNQRRMPSTSRRVDVIARATPVHSTPSRGIIHERLRSGGANLREEKKKKRKNKSRTRTRFRGKLKFKLPWSFTLLPRGILPETSTSSSGTNASRMSRGAGLGREEGPKTLGQLPQRAAILPASVFSTGRSRYAIAEERETSRVTGCSGSGNNR